MAGQTITTIDGLLKDFYVDKIIEEVKQNQPLSDYWKKRDDMPTDGRQVLYPAHVNRNSGVGAVGAGANLPTAGYQDWQDIKVPYRYNYARIQLDAQSLKATKSSRGAFAKVFDAEILGAAKDLGRDRNRQMFGYGFGVIATIKTTANNATQTLANSYNQSDANAQYNPARFFAAGQLIAGVAANGASVSWVGTVSSVSSDLTQVTFSGAVNATAGELLCRVSTSGSTAVADTGYNKEIMGLLGMVDDGTNVGTYFNLSRTTYPIMQSAILDLNQSPLTPLVMQKAWDLVDQRSDGKISDCFMHHVTLREHLSNLQQFKRYTNEFSQAPDAGWKGAAQNGEVEFNEAPLHVDRDAPYGVIFGLDESELYRYVNEEGKWADEDGTILLRVAGVDAYEARFRIFDNFINDTPNRCFQIQDIGLSASPETIQVL